MAAALVPPQGSRDITLSADRRATEADSGEVPAGDRQSIGGGGGTRLSDSVLSVPGGSRRESEQERAGGSDQRSTSVVGHGPNRGKGDVLFPALEVLMLANNGIHKLEPLLLSRFPKLHTLFLQGNDISNTQGLAELPVLKALILDNNRIKTITKGSLGTCPHVCAVDRGGEEEEEEEFERVSTRVWGTSGGIWFSLTLSVFCFACVSVSVSVSVCLCVSVSVSVSVSVCVCVLFFSECLSYCFSQLQCAPFPCSMHCIFHVLFILFLCLDILLAP